MAEHSNLRHLKAPCTFKLTCIGRVNLDCRPKRYCLSSGATGAA